MPGGNTDEGIVRQKVNGTAMKSSIFKLWIDCNTHIHTLRNLMILQEFKDEL